MSAFPDHAMSEQAIAWHLRLQDGDENAWLEFAEWLAADPAHNQAYEALVDCDERMLPVLAKATFPAARGEYERPPEFANDEEAPAFGAGGQVVRRNPWRWGALAASLAVAGLLGVQMFLNRDTTYPIETSAGETRTVSLADGSEIQLNGGTRILLDKSDVRLVEIARGEALFAVKHDDADPFTVVAGEHRLIDIGTVFNVIRTDRHLRVGVVEGVVRYAGKARAVELGAGDSLAADNGGTVEISRRPIASIGSWADGVLVYDQAPFQEVADDLSRSIGISLELPRRMRSRTFSGVIQTDGDRNAVRARLEELIGEKIVADGTHWSVEAR